MPWDPRGVQREKQAKSRRPPPSPLEAIRKGEYFVLVRVRDGEPFVSKAVKALGVFVLEGSNGCTPWKVSGAMELYVELIRSESREAAETVLHAVQKALNTGYSPGFVELLAVRKREEPTS